MTLPQLSPLNFTYRSWEAGAFHKELGIELRYDKLNQEHVRRLFKEHALGWCPAEKLTVRPKVDHVALMLEVDGQRGWFHLTNKEFNLIFGD